MALKTQPEQIRDNLQQSWDNEYYSHIYALMRYILGEKYSPHWGFTGGSELPDFPDIHARFYGVGESRRIMVNASLMAMKTTFADPQIEFPDLATKYREQVNRAYIKALWRGDNSEEAGEWQDDVIKAFLDGDTLGAGYIQIGMRDGQPTIRHSPILDTILDRHALSPAHARFIAFVHHFPVETAEEIFGSRIRSKAVETTWEGSKTATPMRRVRVIEYFDMGLRKNKPTWAYLLNDLAGEVLELEENPYECLPFAYYIHIQLWKMRRPIGRADFQIGSQEFRNLLERVIRRTLERGAGIDVLDMPMIGEDAEDLAKGRVLPVVRKQSAGDVRQAVLRLPPQDVPPGIWQALYSIDREMTGESGNSEADRANIAHRARTLGEIQQVQQGADISSSWSAKQYALLLRRLVTKVRNIGAKLHTRPILLDVGDVTVMFNDPNDPEPESDIRMWLREPTRVVVKEDPYQFQDADLQAQRKLAIWLPLLSDPYLDPISIRREILSQMGMKEPERYLMGVSRGIPPVQSLQEALMQAATPAEEAATPAVEAEQPISI